MDIRERLIVALDVESIDKALDIVDRAGDDIITYKVGLQMYSAFGNKIIDALKERDKKIFLDLKFHDIPNTVLKATEVAFHKGVDMLTIHSMGGFSMMESVAKLIWQWKDHGKQPPVVLGVTLLTSLDGAFLEDIIGAEGRTVEEEVVILARAVKSAGLTGVVASPGEISHIREECGDDFLIVTPGIRPLGYGSDDQARVSTPEEAIRRGADYIVVGRPITQSKDISQSINSILDSMKAGING